jgi:acyl carrier protein
MEYLYISDANIIAKLEEEYEELEPGTLRADTPLYDYIEWSSISALVMIALAETEFGVALEGADLQDVHTVVDLRDLMTRKAEQSPSATSS